MVRILPECRGPCPAVLEEYCIQYSEGEVGARSVREGFGGVFSERSYRALGSAVAVATARVVDPPVVDPAEQGEIFAAGAGGLLQRRTGGSHFCALNG